MDPPRPARDGLEWVWFPEGYWAEREIRDFSPGVPSVKQGSRPKWWNRSPERKSKGSDKSGKAETSSRTAPPTAPVDLPRIHIGSLLSRKASKISKPATNEHSASTPRNNSGGQHGDKANRLDVHANTNIPKYYAIAPAEQLGLYCRTKKTIRTKFLPKATVADDVLPADTDAEKVASRTTMILEGTSHYLDRVERERYPPSDLYTSSATSHTPGTPGSRSLRRFGLAPWHRRSSHESNLSASSSVFKLLLGKAPSATPDPEQQYEAKDGRAYQRVDISSPDPLEPNYLPSEAKRVNTPPMFPGNPAVQARGLFFDLNATSRGDNINQSTSGGSTGSSSIAAVKRSAATSPSLDWWEADTKHVFTGSKATKALSPPRPSFELNLPEHLPSSPLCPKNPKHKSGGSGICPFARKRSGTKAVKDCSRRLTLEENGTAEIVKGANGPWRLIMSMSD
ncbi:uncharacterized protein L3040_001832 [Drepanopeziza brunnea f. sp. 'multigermtubi']|uniref:uncharacterized protein n=1 Tax=Drepanopeziza brunnea f. sp. 'multigermtubi' TaxID=698441 RepID=UPI002389C417|nr:hypothetical protein L3040_001832 [Drepanopeziza brunnea f. sp. 'multigermtubi']